MTGRPELGEIKVGDTVYVHRSMNGSRRGSPNSPWREAEVTSAARVWIKVRIKDSPYRTEMRMRRDTQDEGTQYPGNNAWFATVAQREYDDAMSGARKYLREQGITVDPRSPWRGQEPRLADIIRRAMEE